mgnify:CR=1 FL=1
MLIDGQRMEDLTQHEVDMIADDVFDKLREANRRGEIGLLQIIELFGCDSCDVDHIACEQCNDFITTTTYNI